MEKIMDWYISFESRLNQKKEIRKKVNEIISLTEKNTVLSYKTKQVAVISLAVDKLYDSIKNSK